MKYENKNYDGLGYAFSLYSFGQQVGNTFNSLEGDGLSYRITSATTVEVIGAWDRNRTYFGISVPPTVSFSRQVFQVTKIGDDAFQGFQTDAVYISNTVVSIGNNAFANTYIPRFELPNSIVSIGAGAFLRSIAFTVFDIPASVTSIGANAFYGCESLNAVVIPNAVTSLGNSAFENCTGLTSVTIGNGVTRIPERTFEGCDRLPSVTIPNSVTSIGGAAFQGCRGLLSVIIGNGVTSIGGGAFERCENLNAITIPNSVTSIGAGTFAGCYNLASLAIGNSVASIGEGAFANCRALTSVTIPGTINNIGNYVFSGSERLNAISVLRIAPLSINTNTFQGIEIPNITLNVPVGTKSAYEAAAFWTDFNPIIDEIVVPNLIFASNGINYIVTKASLPYEVAVGSNSSFAGVATIPTTVSNAGNSFAVTSISDNAFSGSTGLTAVSIPNSVTTIGNGAFSTCTGLTSTAIPNSVASIGTAAFNGCINLASVTIPTTLTSIGAATFRTCLSLTSVVIPNLVTSIGEFAFQGCSSLASVSIPNSVTSIGNSAFSSCSSLTSVTIPNRVTFIGTSAFSNCSRLTSAIIPNSIVNISNATFSGCSALTSVTIPNSVTSIGLEAFNNCSSLTSVSIPNSVTSIGAAAFSNCSSLALVSVNWTTPITINSNVFGGLVLSNIRLNVPVGTNATYNLASVWKDFLVAKTVFNYCRGEIAQPLIAPFVAGSTVRWYTTATGGRALTTVPTPVTTTVGTKLYYVSNVVRGIESVREAITVHTFALPSTPANIAGTAAQGALVGTTTSANYTIAPVSGAVSYAWTAPAGVSIVSGQGTNTISVNFANVTAGAGAIGNLSVIAVNNNDCRSLIRSLALTKALPAAPTAIKMTDDSLPLIVNAVTGLTSEQLITSFAEYMGTSKVLTLTTTLVVGVSAYLWELPAGVNVVSGATTSVGVTLGSNVIRVNFTDVTTANTYNYTTSAGVLTYVLRIGVKAVTGTGVSITSNTAATEPATTSTARLLTLRAILPTAPAAILMTDAASLHPTNAITVISNFIGTSKVFTLSATPSATASSYSWELPAGVNQLSGGNTNIITVNFAGVGSGLTTLYLGVKAINGIGASTTINSANPSTARLLRLTATIPASVSSVNGQVTNLCGNVSYNYTIASSLLATSYLITAPAGSIVKSVSNMANSTNTLSTSDLSFMVTYPNGFVATTAAPQSIVVTAVNGVGSSLTNRTLVLSTLVPAIGVPTGETTFQRSTAQVFAVPAILGVTTYTWTVADGAVIIAGQGTNSVTVDFSGVPVSKTTNRLTVVATNACGNSSAARAITLRSTVSATRKAAPTSFAISTTEVYPNPVSSNFNIDVTASNAGTLEIAIYSLDGTLVLSPKSVQLQEGTNTVTENVAALRSGIYILQLANTSNNEVITKKLVKE